MATSPTFAGAEAGQVGAGGEGWEARGGRVPVWNHATQRHKRSAWGLMGALMRNWSELLCPQMESKAEPKLPLPCSSVCSQFQAHGILPRINSRRFGDSELARMLWEEFKEQLRDNTTCGCYSGESPDVLLMHQLP